MQRSLITILIVILGLPMLAQDIKFPSAIVSAGGGSEGGSITLSRWRLAPIYVFTLPKSSIKEIDVDDLVDWEVKLYPNPVENYLTLEFDLPEERKFLLKITDVAGQVIYVQVEAGECLDVAV